jgi:soluble lytic murein transglycosylase
VFTAPRLAYRTRLAGVVLMLCVCSAFADGHARFLAAERALDAGDQATFERLAAASIDDPLYPYLRFAALTRDLAATSDQEIGSFLEAYAGSPLAARLRAAYLDRLAGLGRWADYARHHQLDGSTERRCWYLRSLIETGRADDAWAQIEPLWLSARSQPDACDPVFAAWREAGGLTPERTLARVRLAMEAGERGLVRHLGRLLPESARARHQDWLAVDADPTLVMDAARILRQDPQDAPLAAHGLVRLAAGEPERALEALDALSSLLASDEAAWVRAHVGVGRALTRAGDRRGLAIWDRVPASEQTRGQQEQRLRAAIALRAWDRVVDWVGRMPDDTTTRDRWRYWQGRAEAALGRDRAARASFEASAQGRGLWSFMAADRLAQPYSLDHRAVPADPARIRAVVRSPVLARIRALARLGRETDGRREWRDWIQQTEGSDLLALAYVADVLGWHAHAIEALAKAEYWDDLNLRFPVRHRDRVREPSWETALDEPWVLAVIRQESLFAPSVASHAGAIGLMQLMPETAREVAVSLGSIPPSRSDLLRPESNIRLGTAYLARMRDRFGHAALATAAYNAGPARVIRWLPDACLEADLWIMAIPFEETRRYVERVLSYRVIYGARLGQTTQRVSEWLPPIPSASFFGS